MKNYSKYLIIFLVAQMILALTFSSCKKDRLHPNFTSDVEIPTVPSEGEEGNNGNSVTIYSQNKIASTINGLVVDEAGNPIPNADVSMHGHLTTTDANGAFEYYGALVPENRTYVKVTKQGFFTGSRAIITNQNAPSSVKIMMQSSASVATLDVSTGGVASLPNGSKVEFPANAIMQDNGSAYTGSFDVAVKYMDPEDPNFGYIMPGDLDAINADGELAVLHSFGMLNVELTGSAGEKLQIKSGSEATITVPVPSSMLGDASSSIPLWWFDETVGIWKEDGAATLQGGVYVGQVSHFTSWNCDWQGPRAYVEGHVTDCNGNPVSGITVFTDNQTTITDVNGYYSRWVAADPSIVIDVQANMMNGAVVSPISQVGPLTSGQTVTQDLQTNCLTYLAGDMVDCNNNPISGSLYITTNGQSVMHQITGPFSLMVLPNSTVNYFAYGSNGQTGGLQTISVGAQGTTTNLTAVACGQTIGSNEFVINGGPHNNDLVQFPSSIQVDGSYYTNGGMTYIDMYDQSQQAYVTIYFPGNTTGSFNTAANPNMNIQLSYQGTSSDSLATGTPAFNLLISKYDPVGGLIEGTYDGNFTDNNGNAITITNGKLSALRLQDQ